MHAVNILSVSCFSVNLKLQLNAFNCNNLVEFSNAIKLTFQNFPIQHSAHFNNGIVKNISPMNHNEDVLQQTGLVI